MSSANYEEVHKSPLNKSISKQMYSFGKAPRFISFRNSASSGAMFYNIPSSFSSRSCSLGYGSRSDFTVGRKNQSPSFYDIPSCFSQKKLLFSSCTFGAGRDKLTHIDKCIPGPGKYDITKPFGSDAVKFSVGKDQLNYKGRKSSNVPGPGQYNSVNNNLYQSMGYIENKEAIFLIIQIHL